MRFSSEQQPNFVTVCKVLNIMYRHAGGTYMIPGTWEMHAAGVIDIFEKHLKHAHSLLCSILSYSDILFIAAEFQDCMIKSSIRYEESTTHYPPTDA